MDHEEATAVPEAVAQTAGFVAQEIKVENSTQGRKRINLADFKAEKPKKKGERTEEAGPEVADAFPPSKI